MTHSPLPKGFLPFHNIDGAKAVVLPDEDGKRVNVVWAHAGPLVDKIEKNGYVQLGPRHEVSLKAWAGTKAEAPKKAAPVAKKAAKAKKAAPKAPVAAVSGDEHRGRGRPRKDGLLPGSYEVGVLNHAHETRTTVPQEVLDKMSPETRLVEEARNLKITEGGGIKRGRPTNASKVTNISDARKAKQAPAAATTTGRRKLVRRSAAK